MYEDIEAKLKKRNKILFSRNSKCLQVLLQEIRVVDHRTLILWSFACVEEILKVLDKRYPLEKRARNAYTLCVQWAKGEVKMPIAKRAILDCHAVCKELKDEVDIALFHAVGQGLSCVHVETHAIGLAIYELSAIVLQDKEQYHERIQKKITSYIHTLSYYEKNKESIVFPWADFLCKNYEENKEMLLWKKNIRCD